MDYNGYRTKVSIVINQVIHREIRPVISCFKDNNRAILIFIFFILRNESHALPYTWRGNRTTEVYRTKRNFFAWSITLPHFCAK